jgi:branched-chain amino acid transport system ATP-binding protein
MKLLEVENVSRAFGGVLAVNRVSFHLDRGEVLGLIGPNGAGKSTLFNLISGIFRPHSGKITFNGQDITRMAPYRICGTGIARTFQLVKPFPRLTPLENVMVGRAYGSRPARNRTEARADSEQILAFTHLANRDTPADMLSLVDRKRLEIARALATRPQLLLLDEMMAGLNQAELDGAIALIKAIRDSGISMIVVEHVMKVIMGISDRIIVLKTGEKIADGTPQEIVANAEVVRAYLGGEVRAED